MLGYACDWLHKGRLRLVTGLRPQREVGLMLPLEVHDFPFLSSDAVEFFAVFIAMLISFAVMVALGQWWSR